MPSSEMLPGYFGAPQKPLFGCYHTPRPGRRREHAAIICQPIGHEYMNSQRALRQLGVRLSHLGFPVLRFDYFGCGDSSGEGTDPRISDWIDDLSEAISEMKARAGGAAVCLVGLRLGATLALMAAAQRSDIRVLVLWDPVVNGREYLETLTSLSRELLRFRAKPRTDPKLDWPKDILGFPVSRELYQDIEAIDLLAMRSRPADQVLIVETGNQSSADPKSLKHQLETNGCAVSLQRIDAPLIWLPAADGSLKVPVNALQNIASWLERVCP